MLLIRFVLPNFKLNPRFCKRKTQHIVYFADSLVSSISSDDYTVSAFTGKNLTDGKTHIILINKSIHDETKVSVNLGDSVYKTAESYILDGNSPVITKSSDAVKIKNGVMTVKLEPLTINHFVLQ